MPKKKQRLCSGDEAGRSNVNTATGTQRRTRGRITRAAVQLSPSLPEVVAKRQNTGMFSANSSHRDEEAGKERRVMGASLLTNVLALVDTLGVKKDFLVDADQLLFLDTVRVISVVPDVAVVPAKDVYAKILSGIQETRSLRVIVASFRLLHDLDLRHPHVSLKTNGTGEKKEFVDNKEQVWSPFEVAAPTSDNRKRSAEVSMDLFTLLENIADDLDREPTPKKRGSSVSSSVVRNKDPFHTLTQFLMLRWLVSLLDSDFQVRQQAFQENPEEVELMQESLVLRFLMRSGNTKFKDIFSNLLRIIVSPGASHDPKQSRDCGPTSEASSVPGFFISEVDFAHLAASLLTMILELESFKDALDKKFGSTRKVISIGSLVENFMGILDYQKASLGPLLQMLESTQLKFKLLHQYFFNHTPEWAKDQVREICTIDKLFDCVSNMNAHKYFYPHELQVLLVAGFQVFLETHTGDDEFLREVCRSFRAAMETITGNMVCEEIHYHARSALVIANALTSE